MAIKCLFLNCTLKRNPQPSNTQALIDKVAGIFHDLGVETETLRVTDYNVRFGSGMDEGDGDQWPQILDKIKATDILVVATPLWLGDRSSVAKMVHERLDATTYMLDEFNQHTMYNKVGGAIVTGEGDGAQHAVAQILYDLTIAGFTIPPNADCFWVGGAGGPGKPYTEKNGQAYYFVNERARWMAYNLTAMAQILKDNPIRTNLKQLQEEATSVSDTSL